MEKFELHSKYTPQGDQPQAIEKLVQGIKDGKKSQVLLGATGTGKTFTVSNVIQAVNKPTLVFAHNKTLAGQLYAELKEFFPNNRVEYFVSNFDYYQPEAYIPSSDVYIDKTATTNQELDMLRMAATNSVLDRKDTIVVASVACIYGASNPEQYKDMFFTIRVGEIIDRKELLKKYYEKEVVGDIKVSHILITANVTDDMTDDEKKNAESEAKDKIEKIISELKKTDKGEVAEKFAELAKEQSMDESTKANGGSLGFINKDTLSSEYDELVTAAYNLKDGKFSTKVITTELGYHVVLRTETKEKASLEDVKEDIKETLAAEYLQKNQIASVKALQELRKSYDLEIVDSELKSQYAAYIQNLLNYYIEQENNSSTK